MRIVLTDHAHRRMVERGISFVEVRDAIARGRKRPQRDRLVSAYRYFEVVYRVESDVAIVITVKPRWP